METGSKRIKLILEYLNMSEQQKKECSAKIYGTAIKIDNMLKIYKSEELEVRKLAAMSKIFKDSTALSKALEGLKEYESEDPKKEKVQSLLNHYKLCDSKDLIDNSSYLVELEENGYFDDYNYSVYFIEKYVNYNESIYLTDFLKENGLTRKEFDRFARVVATLDYDLHQKLLKKYFSDKGQRQYKTIRDIDYLADEFAKGNMYDGDMKCVIDVYSKLPIYKDEYDFEILDDFEVKRDCKLSRRIQSLVRRIKPNAEKDIISYIAKNSMINNEQTAILGKEIYDTDFTINGKTLTKEDKDKIVGFMKEERIPFLTRAFNIIKDEYIKGNLEKDKPKQLLKERK